MPDTSHPPWELLYGKQAVLLQEEKEEWIGPISLISMNEGLIQRTLFLFFTIFCGIAKFVHLRIFFFFLNFIVPQIEGNKDIEKENNICKTT